MAVRIVCLNMRSARALRNSGLHACACLLYGVPGLPARARLLLPPSVRPVRACIARLRVHFGAVSDSR